jgi:hypothetical protein
MDHDGLSYTGATGATRHRTDVFERTATLVVILSPAYLASSWCQLDGSSFVSHLARRPESSVFVVWRDKIDDWEANEFGWFSGFQFWVQDSLSTTILGTPRPDPNDKRYFDRLNDSRDGVG